LESLLPMKDLLAAARREAIAVLAAALADGGIAEPALRNAAGDLALDPEDRLRTPVRKDVARNADGVWVPTNVDARTLRPHAPLQTVWRERLHVTITSMTWDYTRFTLTPVALVTEFALLGEWFLRWFDADDRSGKTGEGLHGVVHFMPDPAERGDAVEIVVGFGSAPVAAFQELLDCFVALGFSACEVK
jgi:hypothetical protein